MGGDRGAGPAPVINAEVHNILVEVHEHDAGGPARRANLAQVIGARSAYNPWRGWW